MLKLMRSLNKNLGVIALKAWVLEHRRSLGAGLIALILLNQMAGFVSVFSAHIDPRSLLSSRDSDASHIVGTADATRWYKDNGEAPYGAFYFRIGRTLNQISGRQFALPSSETENRERAQHLTLMTFQLLCVFAIAYLIATLVFTAREARWLFTSALTAVLLDEFIWATFVFRAHPDMVLAAFVLLAYVLTIRFLEAPKPAREKEESVWFYLSALAWGVCGMIKLTFVVFLPVLVVFFLPPFTRANLRRAFRYYLWLWPSYLLVALPQSLNIPRPLRFLRHQWDYNLEPDWASFMTWVDAFRSQMSRPALIVIALALVSGIARPKLERWRLLPVILFPLAIFFHQKNDYEARYYLMPFVCMIMAWLAISVPRLTSYFRRDRMQIGLAAALLLLVSMTIGLVPARMEAELTPTLQCRAENTMIYERIHAEIARGRTFVLDPYIPFDRERAGTHAFGDWSNDWAAVKARGADAIVINLGYAREFAPGPPNHTRQVDSANWPKMTEFYASLLDHPVATDPEGHLWHRELTSAKCSFEMWLKDNSPAR